MTNESIAMPNENKPICFLAGSKVGSSSRVNIEHNGYTVCIQQGWDIVKLTDRWLFLQVPAAAIESNGIILSIH